MEDPQKKSIVRKRFKTGATSKMAILVKLKGDGTKKRRLMVDLKRSGGNDKATIPESTATPHTKSAPCDEHVRKRGRRRACAAACAVASVCP